MTKGLGTLPENQLLPTDTSCAAFQLYDMEEEVEEEREKKKRFIDSAFEEI
jgi:hypothetical protein